MYVVEAFISSKISKKTLLQYFFPELLKVLVKVIAFNTAFQRLWSLDVFA